MIKETFPIKIHKKESTCYDGPWAGHILALSSSPTLVIRIGNIIGRYRKNEHSKYLMWESHEANKRIN
jgi:hypothetical protein